MERYSPRERYVDVCIIGAGPAGVNAAAYLSEYGREILIIDEAPKPGGAIYRGPTRTHVLASHLDDKLKKEMKDLDDLLHRYASKITVLCETRIVGVLDNRKYLMAYNEEEGLFAIRYEHLIISTGCYERSLPFPGWTLPGVATLGGVQSQVKSNLVKPDGDVVLVGTGPLMLVVAKQLHLAGVKVAGVYESGKRLHLIRKLPLILKHLSLFYEGFDYLSFLRKSNIEVHYGWGMVETRGKKVLEEVVIAPFGSNNKLNLKKSRTISAGMLGVGFGFASRSRVASLIGVEMMRLGVEGMSPKVDSWCKTSLPNVYAAGDVAGIHGAKVASLEGRLAALGILRERGAIPKAEVNKLGDVLIKEVEKYKTFRTIFDGFSKNRLSYLSVTNHSSPVCACENVTLAKIDEAIARGIHDMKNLKMATRVSMGDCQGERCGEFCRNYLKEKTGKTTVSELDSQFPISLVTFNDLIGDCSV